MSARGGGGRADTGRCRRTGGAEHRRAGAPMRRSPCPTLCRHRRRSRCRASIPTDRNASTHRRRLPCVRSRASRAGRRPAGPTWPSITALSTRAGSARKPPPPGGASASARIASVSMCRDRSRPALSSKQASPPARSPATAAPASLPHQFQRLGGKRLSRLRRVLAVVGRHHGTGGLKKRITKPRQGSVSESLRG